MLSAVRRNGILANIQPCRLAFLFSSTANAAAATNTAAPLPELHSLVEYLVNSCGLSTGEATKASKYLTHLKTTKKPDAVLDFLRSQGFNRSHFKKIVPMYPKCLCWTVEKTLAPKFRTLRSRGFSESELFDIILSYPFIINCGIKAISLKLDMWESLIGSRQLLIRHIKHTNWFLGCSVEKVIRPNLKLLMDECCISVERASRIVRIHPLFITQKLDSLHSLIRRADELGVPRKSGTFLWTLDVLYTLSKRNLEGKKKFMITLGWSESDFLIAVRKTPTVIRISQNELRRKMEFLVNEVGYTPSFIAHRSLLLIYSLEKRVIPRFRVIQMLHSKGLLSEKPKLLTFLVLPQGKFMEKFVLPHKENIPELLGVVTGS
ncbi:transcription termination factor MTERF15, mitochondrial-like [Canna indica]|uniref:Transcription termination factor MTERF15, mitochondrial-like n=1 Tax=Canna indica TaxID=4628 RepID=A0AAQ3QDJ8_9LILI|nr:transcription termination factor MTERF15, mitochondrial-like [Canna indica]